VTLTKRGEKLDFLKLLDKENIENYASPELYKKSNYLDV
jgi:hypothetical protein